METHLGLASIEGRLSDDRGMIEDGSHVALRCRLVDGLIRLRLDVQMNRLGFRKRRAMISIGLRNAFIGG